jgi:pimeloyl-ACP methyl ester carboxylesterase
MRPHPKLTRRYRPAGEDAFRSRSIRGTRYFRSRQRHEELTIIVERFPGSQVVPVGGGTPRSYVLVHGIGVSSRYFRPLAVELAKTGAVYLVDLPGYGAAPNPRREVTLTDHAAVIASFLRETNLVNPVIVGHSMGTQIVSLLAAKHPDVTDRIVVLAPTMEPTARTPGRAIGRLLHDSTREPPIVFWIAITDYLVRCGLPYLLRQMPHMLTDRIEDRVGTNHANTLVINGDRDPIAPTPWVRELGKDDARTTFRQVHGPHVIMHTDPVMIAKHITDFVTGP